MRRLALIAVPLGVALALPFTSAGSQVSGAQDVSRATAGTYQADPSHTMIGWRVDHMGFNDYFGLLGDVTGTLTINPAQLDQAKVSVRVPIAKILTPSKGLTQNLLTPGPGAEPAKFFGDKPADATFVSTKVTPGADGKSASIEGRLTMNGATRPVTLEAKFVGAGKNPLTKKETLGFHATTRIKRSLWGINGYIPIVGDDVGLEISAAFER